ncbi:Protein O-glucosyltransferase 1 [Hondaea fermentalgiana]|uniref:Protein O-glucosyltransferase 1 n=1 Tax=Hondaea fermentalgiana TaxID=2315210 RepID=A0A2R5GEW6_9STRA|nr:Protein O-glucosyltransferase 1 [Hondaea fermentalgiana]|eukprot:GBG26801.1 Protein O-glucosyltransferase 1 [Hondaea fermentalgiana]
MAVWVCNESGPQRMLEVPSASAMKMISCLAATHELLAAWRLAPAQTFLEVEITIAVCCGEPRADVCSCLEVEVKKVAVEVEVKKIEGCWCLARPKGKNLLQAKTFCRHSAREGPVRSGGEGGGGGGASSDDGDCAAMADPSGGAFLRGIHAPEKEQLETFRNGVPLFDSVEACLAWMRENAKYGSNPADPTLRHIFTHAVDWDQVNEYLLRELRAHSPKRLHPEGEQYYLARTKRAQENGYEGEGEGEGDEAWETSRPNRFPSNFELKPVLEQLDARLDLPFHARTNRASTLNTLNYLFNHMRCGIFILIEDNELRMFVPFVNRNYRNNWSQYLKTDPPNMTDYFNLKRKYYRKENILPVERWWANGNIICNEESRPGERHSQIWGDNLLAPFKHMLETLCRERCVPDCEFFFNKRDHPQLKANLTEPYDFCFDVRDKDLEREKYASYAPIVSFYCSPKFADLPVPTTEDWASAIGQVFPSSFIPDGRTRDLRKPGDMFLKDNFEKFHKDWSEKVNTCFFRGNATGGGTTPETNQRLRLSKLCSEWKLTGTNSRGPADPPLLDAGFIKENVRDKKLFGEPMRFTRKEELGVSGVNYVDMYKQGRYKYILYVEGHCAANRYSFLMRLGSVILKVESECEASEMWFFPLLKPYEGSRENNIDVQAGVLGADHVPVRADLSNLRDQILWCRENDAACRQIAENARQKYQRCLSKDIILDYLQVMTLKIAKRFERAPSWWKVPEPLALPPNKAPSERKCARDPVTGDFIYCRRCTIERERGDAHHGQVGEKRRGGMHDEGSGGRDRKQRRY